MNTTQLAVEMTVYAKENKSIWNITKDKPYKLLEPRNNFYKGAVFGFIDDLGLERIIGIKLLNKYFTTTPPDQKIKQQALAQCDEALKLNSQIGNFGKPNDKDNKPDQEGGSSGLLNGFNDGLHRSSGIGGQSPELSTLDQEGKREEPYHEIIDSTEELISQLQSRVKELEGLNEAAEKHIEIITRERDWQTDVVVPDLDQQIADLKQENERLRGLIKGLVNENERIAKLAKVDPIMKCEKPVPCTDGHDVSEGSSTCSKCGERYIHNPTHRPDKR